MNNITQQVTQWIKKDERFCDLILTPDGNLYFDQNHEACADWFMVYHNGRICIRPSGNRYCLGALPHSCVTFPVHLGMTEIWPHDDDCCILRSDFPALDFDVSAFAVFQCGDLVGMYTADTMLSPRIYFKVEVNTPKNKDGCIAGFFAQLERHSPEIRKKVEAWLCGHGASWKGE